MGLLQCFRLNVRQSVVFLSDVGDAVWLGLARHFSVNFDALIAQLSKGDYLTSETCLREVRAVQSGVCVRCAGDSINEYVYWSPVEFLQRKSSASFNTLAAGLRGVVQNCVSAQVGSHRRVLHAMSGGLDSSIVLSCLRSSPSAPDVTGVTYFSRGSGDERQYARAMARRAGCRLVELSRDAYADLGCFANCVRSARPLLNFSAPDSQRRNAELAAELGATALFDGELGDSVFGASCSVGMLVERFRARRATPSCGTILLHYAILSRQSVWRAALLAAREHFCAQRRRDYSAYEVWQNLIKADGSKRALGVASAEALSYYRHIRNRFIHPWMRGARVSSPGSISILFGLIIMNSAPYTAPFAEVGGPERISPLTAQPLVEFCLKVPSYMHVVGAKDRSLARAAFTAQLPADIVGRGAGKGGPSLWVRDVLLNRASLVRDFLLDGILAEQRLIDRASVETALRSGMAQSTVTPEDIFAALYMEGWLRQWRAAGVT